jgi:hypothetical protein
VCTPPRERLPTATPNQPPPGQTPIEKNQKTKKNKMSILCRGANTLAARVGAAAARQHGCAAATAVIARGGIGGDVALPPTHNDRRSFASFTTTHPAARTAPLPGSGSHRSFSAGTHQLQQNGLESRASVGSWLGGRTCTPKTRIPLSPEAEAGRCKSWLQFAHIFESTVFATFGT